jgi:hypothetical protein
MPVIVATVPRAPLPTQLTLFNSPVILIPLVIVSALSEIFTPVAVKLVT